MSRSVSSTVETAITSKETYKTLVKAVIDPSRSYFSSLTDDDPYDGGDYSVPTDTPVGQAVVYSPTRGGLVTFVVDPVSGVIYAMDQGDNTKNNLGLTADEETKPAVATEKNGYCRLWYWDGSELERKNINMSNFAVTDGPNPQILNTPHWDIVKGSPTWLSESKLVFTYQTSKGGLGVVYFDGGDGQKYHWDGRFVSPNTAVDNGYWSIYSTGAILDGTIFVYSTDITTGEVRGVTYSPYKGRWGDSFVAMPADLSRFCIANAASVNGYIHIAGQFHRTEDLANAQVYSLVVRSKDGYTFSWDRFTLISKLGYRFHIAVDSATNKLYASDRNSVGEASLSYFFASTPSNRTTLQPPNDILEFTSDGSENAMLSIKAHDEAYLNHAVVKRGSRCKLYLGYSTATGIEYTHYMTYIIDGVRNGHADGKRMMVLSLVAEGVWKASQIAFPFYSEIISKSTSIDDCDERDNMYPASGGARLDDHLAIDFWQHEGWDGGGVTSCTPANYHTSYGMGVAPKKCDGNYTYGFRTPDLSEVDFITGLPEITQTTLQVKLYGWCASSNKDRNGDLFYIYIVTEDEDGVETEHNGSLQSNYSRFTKYYKNATAAPVDGSEPIIYGFSSLTIGHYLKYIAIKQVNADSVHYSVVCPERLEITNCSIKYSNLNTECAWLQTKPSTYDEDDPTLLEVPAWGVPYIQFLTKPYTAFNFSVNADFVYEAGSSPVYNGTMGWGVVGMAEDAANYVVARYNLGSSAVELAYIRNGAETVLTYYSFVGQSAPTSIMLRHKDGTFRVHYKSSNIWSEPIIEWHWNEVTHGVISTSDTGIMHVGVYGALATDGFRHCSFNLHDADGLAALPSYKDSIIGLSSGYNKLILDNVVYKFNGKWKGKDKIGGRVRGPYQAIACGYKNNEPGVEIALERVYSDNDFLNNYLFASDNGHTWNIIYSNWSVDQNYASSWHHCELATGNYVGESNRVYVSVGVANVERYEEGDIYYHPHGYWAFIWGTNRIWVKEVLATTLDHDATVKDMTNTLCLTASVEADYPGDWTSSSESITATPTELASTDRLFPGGYDVSFRLPPLTNTHWVAVYASNLYVGNTNEAINIAVKNQGGYLRVYAYPKNGTETPTYIDTTISSQKYRDVRILFHDLFCSVYIDDSWIHTFGWNRYDEDDTDHTGDIKWPDSPIELYMYSSNAYTVTNIVVSELFDWREAIYVESEMSAASALGSVLQERPVEIFPTVAGGLSFSYNIERDTITYNTTTSKRLVREHSRSESTSSNAGSDAIVYYRDITFANDLTFADNEGFLTRVMKLSGLDTGAATAAILLLEKANEKQYAHVLRIRPDIRIEQGDIIALSYTLVGTDTTLNYNVIVEDVTVRIAEGESEMVVTAREVV